MLKKQLDPVMTFMRQLWPEWTNGAEVLLYSQEFGKYEENGVLALLKEAAKVNDYPRPSKKFIFAELRKLRKQGYESMSIIPVFALRDDGKSVTCFHTANDHEHARTKMRNWMNQWRDVGRDCNPDQLTFYVGEENYHAFTAARRERRRAG